MKRANLGGLGVGRIGLGAMGMSVAYAGADGDATGQLPFYFGCSSEVGGHRRRRPGNASGRGSRTKLSTLHHLDHLGPAHERSRVA